MLDTEYIDIDEDLIRAYYCIVCKANVCKDDVFKRLDGKRVVCLSCGEWNELF